MLISFLGFISAEYFKVGDTEMFIGVSGNQIVTTHATSAQDFILKSPDPNNKYLTNLIANTGSFAFSFDSNDIAIATDPGNKTAANFIINLDKSGAFILRVGDKCLNGSNNGFNLQDCKINKYTKFFIVRSAFEPPFYKADSDFILEEGSKSDGFNPVDILAETSAEQRKLNAIIAEDRLIPYRKRLIHDPVLRDLEVIARKFKKLGRFKSNK